MTDSNKQQTPASPARKHFSHKKWWIIVAIFVVLFLAGAVASWLYVSNQKTAQKQEAALLQAKRSQEVNQTAGAAEKLINNGKPEEAKAVYDTAIKQTTDPYQKSILLLSKANLSLNDEKYDDALAIAKEAEAINQNSVVTQYIAQVYEAMGDAPNAIKYYQKTIPLVDKSKPLAAADIKYFQARIEALGGAKN